MSQQQQCGGLMVQIQARNQGLDRGQRKGKVSKLENRVIREII